MEPKLVHTLSSISSRNDLGGGRGRTLGGWVGVLVGWLVARHTQTKQRQPNMMHRRECTRITYVRTRVRMHSTRTTHSCKCGKTSKTSHTVTRLFVVVPSLGWLVG